jgi:type I restriction enzyme S subunit
VARIDELAAQINEARDLHEQIEIQYRALLRSFVFSNKDCVLTPMNELVVLRKADVTVEAEKSYHFAGVYSFGRGVFSGPIKAGSEFAYKRLSRLHTGDFVHPKLMALEGALAVVPSECNQLFVSPEFMVFEIDQNRVLPETLDVYFRTPAVWPKLSGESTGTNVRRRRLHPDDFLAYKMPLPSIQVQKRLRAICAQNAFVRPLQVQILKELEALIPSILDRAFHGGL